MFRYKRADSHVTGDMFSIRFFIVVTSRAPSLDISYTECEGGDLMSHSEKKEELFD